MKGIRSTELFRAMLQSGDYDDAAEVVEIIQEMRDSVAGGENPEEVLHEEGFEPDYIFDIV